MRNRYIVWVAMVAGVLGFSSCGDFLDELPDNRTELNETNVDKLLLSAYPNSSVSLIAEMSSDNTDAFPNRFATFSRLEEELYHWKDASESNTDSPAMLWEQCYLAIAACNQVLATIEKAGKPATLNPQRGEALVCRAYNHFLLANVFCRAYSTKATADLGIPYMKANETTVSPAYLRGTLEEVYKQIEADLLEGLPLLNDNAYQVPKYHFTRKAAHAFAARFYLYYVKADRSNYEQVIAYASKIFGSNPTMHLRNWKSLGELDVNNEVQPNAYVDANNGANLLLISGHSYFGMINGPYSYGARYAHGPQVAKETCNSNGPWGNYVSIPSRNVYYFSVWDNATALPTKVMLRKVAQYREVLDVVTGTFNGYTITPSFTTDEALLCRAEAYALKGQYVEAVADLNAWRVAYTRSITPLTVESITAFYESMPYYTPSEPTCKKELHPDFAIEAGTQLNLIHCILHARRILTLHDGLRWFDIKRYGIEVHRRLFNDNGTLSLTDKLGVEDPRQAIQLPSDAIAAGMQPNPRNN